MNRKQSVEWSEKVDMLSRIKYLAAQKSFGSQSE